MKVDIWSDMACPFCYIGKKNLELALQKFIHKDQVQVSMRSFELDPNAKKDLGISVHEMLSKKYGLTLEQAKNMNESVTNRAAEVGLKFDLDRTIPTNSFDAHRLLHLAKQKNLQSQVQDKIFAAYFSLGKDISKLETLVEIGVSAGIDKEEIEQVLSGDQFAEDVRGDEQQAHEYGLTGVPAFVINEKYLVSGAQPSEVLLSALEEAWNENQSPHKTE